MLHPNVCAPLVRDRRLLRSYGIVDRPGCYAAFSFYGKCLYVGKSVNLFTRIMSHFIDQEDGFGVQWRLSGLTEWYITKPFAQEDSLIQLYFYSNCDDLEEYLIKTLNPLFNVFTKTGKRNHLTKTVNQHNQ